MNSRQKPPERLEKKLARGARGQGIDQERLRHWVSFLALCGVLERACHENILGFLLPQRWRRDGVTLCATGSRHKGPGSGAGREPATSPATAIGGSAPSFRSVQL